MAVEKQGGWEGELDALRLVLGRVPAFVWKFCPARRQALFASEAIRELSGLEREAFLKDPEIWNARVGEDDESRRALAAGEAAQRAGKAFEAIYRFRTVQRGERWFQSTATPAIEDGELVYYGCTTDITERREAETAHGRLAAALEQADEAFIITDREGVIGYVNGAFERMTGYRREEVLGNQPSMLKSGRQDAAFYGELWSTIRNGQPWRGRFINRRKDGSCYEQWATITPLLDERGEVEGFVAVQLDMSWQWELERRLAQAERLASVGSTISGAAHTVKNILNTMRGSAYMIEQAVESSGSEKLRTVWDIFARSTTRLDELTHQMLDYVRDEAPALEPLDLNKLGQEVIEACRATAERDKVALNFTPAEGLPRVPCDRVAMHDAMLNLIGNAIEACGEHGGGRVWLETGGLPEEGQVEVRIGDNGPGIPPATMEKLFTPFFTTKGHKGNGLGLAMVQKTMQAHRGRIDVESEPGRTCFRLRLPL